MARILLGVSGGIAAYKSLEFARLALAAGHSLRVVQTEASTRFVGTASFAAITGAPVLVTEWERDPMRGTFPDQPMPDHEPLSHLQLVAAADLYLIAPASANTISKLAAGAADNLLTAAALACRRPLVVAPAMNDAMYQHAATQANLERLRERGVTVLDPGVGSLGSPGEWGIGRLPEPAELLRACEALLAAGGGPLDGLRVLVTAGGTREPIDSVRFIGNRSSGRMGFALAEEAAARGAEVTVIAANVALPRLPGLRYVDVGTAAEMREAAAAEFDACDVLLMAAAVADFRPVRPVDDKIKKEGASSGLELALAPTEDVLTALSARRRPGQTLVGFAAEHGEGALDHGRAKLERKDLDAVVVNDISRPGIGFDAGENEVTVVTRAGDVHVPRAGKAAVARAILDAVSGLRAGESAEVR